MSANCKCECSAAPKLIFACSGAADVGAIADQAARKLTRDGAGKMFCLAGIGGRVSGIIKTTEAAQAILSIFMSFCLFALTACGEEAEAEKSEPAAKSEAVQTLPKLLDLGAHKCIPCKMMAPILDELAKEYKGVFDVEFIDVWQSGNKEKAKAHGISSIPTQIFFDATGKELWRHEGFIAKEDILKKWNELGFAFQAVLQEKSSAEPAVPESE